MSTWIDRRTWGPWLLAGLAACSEQHAAEAPPGGSEQGRARPRAPLEHVILISLDTLRADHCSLYGYGKPTTPFLTELGERGLVFENHMVSSNNTLSSHASIMTGLYPMAHDTEDSADRRQILAPAFRTLAEAFSEAGFATASFAAHGPWLGREFGVMQGFEKVEAAWVDSRTCWERFTGWFDAEQPQRSFVFLHSFDVHSDDDDRGNVLPYESSEEWIEKFAPPQPADFTGCLQAKADQCASNYLAGINAGDEALPAEHLEYLVGLYDAGIRKQDGDLRRLFTLLAQRGLLEQGLVVITADHGEEFMEHGHLLHVGTSDMLMRVPLLIVPPASWGLEPRRISQVTRSIDIAPTLLDLCGLAPIGQGHSLRPVLEGAAELPASHPEEVFFAMGVLRGRDEHGAFKFLGGTDRAFYDLDADPLELTNLCLDPAFAGSERLRVASARLDGLRQTALRLRDEHKLGQDFQPAPKADDVQVIEALHDLGYVDVGGDEE